jgi:hypothetical protein
VVGSLVWARANFEPGNVLPNSTNNIIDVMLISPRRDRAALNRSSPDFPPNGLVFDATLLERYKVTNFGCNPLGASAISTLYNESNVAYRFPIVKPHALELVGHIG